MPRRLKKSAEDWTQVKLFQNSSSLLMARGYAEWEREQDEIATSPYGGLSFDREKQMLEKLSPALIELFDLNEENWEIDGVSAEDRYHEVLYKIDEIVNVFEIIRRVSDFQIALEKPVKRLFSAYLKGTPCERLLTDEQFKEVSEIVSDAMHFEFEENYPDNLFSILKRVESRIRSGETPEKNDVVRLNSISKTRQQGRSKEYALKYLAIAASEFFERHNSRGENGTISFSEIPIHNNKQFNSVFLEFFEDLSIAIEAGYRFNTDATTRSRAKQIIESWRKLPKRKSKAKVILGGDLPKIIDLLDLV